VEPTFVGMTTSCLLGPYLSNLKRQIKLHLPNSTPDQAIFALVLGRLRLTV
jgi:hypothetical protein